MGSTRRRNWKDPLDTPPLMRMTYSNDSRGHIQQDSSRVNVEPCCLSPSSCPYRNQDPVEEEPNDIVVWDTPSRTPHPHYNHENERLHGVSRYPPGYERNQHLRDSYSSSLILRPKSSASLYQRSAVSSASRSKSARSLDIRSSESFDGNSEQSQDVDHLANLTRQLEMIKGTQDSILNQLSDEMSTLQFENVQLKNTNEHLTMQNSHLLHVISDLSSEVEHMREVFRIRGWSTHQIVDNDQNKNVINTNENKDKQDKPESSSKEKVPSTGSSRRSRDSRRRKSDGENINENEKTENHHHQHSHSRGHRRRRKYDTDVLDEQTLSPTNKPSLTSDSNMPVPGEEQVATLSKRSTHGDLTKNGSSSNGRRRSSRTHRTSSSNNNFPRSRSSQDDDETSKPSGCFRGLFRKKNKKNHSTFIDDNVD